ncbi:hypothetical protein PICMEDRAFT_14429 [Pichia membranifaciens NRRL Y-2026]|uniref:Mitochondrial adapter protein MCP1 transmembrane domain-containing protein n=1 Tax=Pichia membranifaciens NRRL Y-2026 TaxID=763406 RepID=A0A1E3NTC4_9ASCO|nr:hypothetical protein PICMEDRAFT_14429 [Pichia membranifaciens NRRL Y-2026]ODQ48908.1 hypothetical protein PICMEDRAFT_14429 [Pichia membranifaciens NRRL Y-2026]
MSELHEVAPEPVQMAVPGIPPSLPSSGTTHPYLMKSIDFLRTTQQYSVIPFSAFSALHVASVVVGPALFGPEVGNDMISVGRELYHVPLVELGILVSACVHVVSGIAVNLLRQYYNYVKYGKAKRKKNQNRTKLETAMKITRSPNDVEVRDIDEGLGGISSIVGAGSRPSITSRFLGLSPLAFSGYVLLVLLGGHVYYERVAPLLVDGDSSMIDMTYIAHGLQQKFWEAFTALNLLVATGCYHMLVGWNRYLRRFSLRARKNTYLTLGVLSALCCASLLRVRNLDVFAAAAHRFDIYLAQ